MYESTTCDEHEEHEEEGLRAWNLGMTRALWPKYSAGKGRLSSTSAAIRGVNNAPALGTIPEAPVTGSLHMTQPASAASEAGVVTQCTATSSSGPASMHQDFS